MPTTPRQQMTLAADANFIKRITALLLSEAMIVAGEPEATEHHAERRKLAQQIINNPIVINGNPSNVAASLAPTIANGTNLVAATTTYNFEAGAVETSASDAEIRSQIATLWNTMAGV